MVWFMKGEKAAIVDKGRPLGILILKQGIQVRGAELEIYVVVLIA